MVKIILRCPTWRRELFDLLTGFTPPSNYCPERKVAANLELDFMRGSARVTPKGVVTEVNNIPVAIEIIGELQYAMRSDYGAFVDIIWKEN